MNSEAKLASFQSGLLVTSFAITTFTFDRIDAIIAFIDINISSISFCVYWRI